LKRERRGEVLDHKGEGEGEEILPAELRLELLGFSQYCLPYL